LNETSCKNIRWIGEGENENFLSRLIVVFNGSHSMSDDKIISELTFRKKN